MVVPDKRQVSESKYLQGYDANFNSFESKSIVTIIHHNKITTRDYGDWVIFSRLSSSLFLIVSFRNIRTDSPVRNTFKNLIVTLK